MSSKMESIRKRFSMDLKDYIESIPGFPKEGIIFRDVTPILQNASAMRYCVDQLNDFVKSVGADVVIGPEARGFFIWCASGFRK